MTSRRPQPQVPAGERGPLRHFRPRRGLMTAGRRPHSLAARGRSEARCAGLRAGLPGQGTGGGQRFTPTSESNLKSGGRPWPFAQRIEHRLRGSVPVPGTRVAAQSPSGRRRPPSRCSCGSG